MEDRRSDEDLVNRFLCDGDLAAIDALIRRYRPKLRRLIYSLSGADAEAIADIEQEVYITLIRRLNRFRGTSAFATFFYSLARNRIYDATRRQRRERDRTACSDLLDEVPGRFDSPHRTLSASEDAAMVRCALARLSPTDRMLLYLKDGEGERIRMLCGLTGLPSGTIKSRLARARRSLARHLEDLGYER